MALSARKELYSILNHWTEVAGAEDFTAPIWGDDRVGSEARNAVADAEMMLAFLTPTFQIESFSLREIHTVDDESVGKALSKLTKSDAYGRALTNCITERIKSFVDRPVSEAFAPGAAGTYVHVLEGADATDDVEKLRVVDAYTMTVSVCVQAMWLLRAWIEHEEQSQSGSQSQVSREDLQATFDQCSERLTYALLGLLRSFTIKTYGTRVGVGTSTGSTTSNEWERENGRDWPGSKDFGTGAAENLRAIRRRLATRFGVERFPDLINGDEIPFACGWSWGPVQDLPWVGDPQLEAAAGTMPTFGEDETPAWAVDAPYLYFTIAAIEGVTDLLETKVRAANILNSEQAYLAQQLGFLVDNTTAYWRALAFAPTTAVSREASIKDENVMTWSIERLPWRTTDGDRDDYYSLYVIGLILGDRSELDRVKLGRLLALLEELAQRARITREPYVFGGKARKDPALEMHSPGKRLGLEVLNAQGEARTPFSWSVDDFAPKLMKLAGIVGQRTQDSDVRRRALALAEQVWERNLLQRRFRYRPDENVTTQGWVWDAPLAPYDEEDGSFDDDKRYSWHMTQRVSDALVSVTLSQERSTTSSEQTRAVTQEILEALRSQGAALGESETRLIDAENMLLSSPAEALQEVLQVVEHLVERRGGFSSNGDRG